MSRKVIIALKIKVVMTADDDLEISDFVNELDYHITDTTTKADIIDTEILNFEVIDSR